MQEIMAKLRDGLNNIGGLQITSVVDYDLGISGLPKSNVLQFRLVGGSKVVIRPSGTEPKIKVYLSIIADGMEEAFKIEKEIVTDMDRRMS